jgi:hypothetical protein
LTKTGPSGGSSLSDAETLAYGKCFYWTLVGNDAVGNASSMFKSEVVRLPKLSFSPSALAFGTITHLTRKVLTETFTNQSGKSLSLTSVKVTGTGFTQALGTTCSTRTPLAAGASCKVNVTFAPLKAGSYSGSVTVAGGDTVAVPLTGTGK